MIKIKKLFFNKKFMTFCIIGGLAYLIHQFIYTMYNTVFGFWDDSHHLLSTGISFIVASIFTYLANAFYTYSVRPTRQSVRQSVLVFAVKFLITEGLALGIMALIKIRHDPSDVVFKTVDALLPLILTALTLILQFFAFNVIFKNTTSRPTVKSDSTGGDDDVLDGRSVETDEADIEADSTININLKPKGDMQYDDDDVGRDETDKGNN